MASYKVLRPIERNGALYWPHPGPDEIVPKTAKSACNGLEITVNAGGTIELAGGEERQFTLGQLRSAVPSGAAGASPTLHPSAASPAKQPSASARGGVASPPAAAGTASAEPPFRPELGPPAPQTAATKPMPPVKPIPPGKLEKPVQPAAKTEAPASHPPEFAKDPLRPGPAKPPASARSAFRPEPVKAALQAEPRVVSPKPAKLAESENAVEPGRIEATAEAPPPKPIGAARSAFGPEPVKAAPRATPLVIKPKAAKPVESAKPIEPEKPVEASQSPAKTLSAKPAEPTTLRVGNPKNG